MDSILIDTDVCIDFITGRMPWNVEAGKIFEASENGKFIAFISGLTYSNLFYIMRKTYGSQKTLFMLSDLRRLSQVSPISSSAVDWALSSGWKDFEDAIQYQSAVENQCQAIVSRNLDEYIGATRIPVLTPTDFITGHLPSDPDEQE
jgi:predicted nucleic acid-binding protein